MRLKPFLSLLSAIFLFFPPSGYALSSWECFGAGAAELFIPGLGYALTAQFDKTLIIGGSRWYTASEYRKASDADDYEEDPDAIYNTTEAEDSESDKTEISVYLNKSTWDANYYGSLYNNLLLTTWGDLYQYGCQPNTETYSLMAAPFRADHYYDNWMFWLPMAIAAANYHYFADYYKVDYYLERGLTERDLRRDSFPKYYMVGVGEEMFFRGTIQHQIFESLQSSFGMSADRSRHWSIIAASAIFAAAHTGAGFTANPLQAFLFGVYEGYVYHPSLEEFDLETAIAIHAWWDILIAYAILNNAKFHEDRKDVYNKNASPAAGSSLQLEPSIPATSLRVPVCNWNRQPRVLQNISALSEFSTRSLEHSCGVFNKPLFRSKRQFPGTSCRFFPSMLAGPYFLRAPNESGKVFCACRQ